MIASLRHKSRPMFRLRRSIARGIVFNHYVVIRFSLRYEDWMQKAYGQESERAAWFAMRAELFKECMVASIQRQTVTPRRAFVLMDVADVVHWNKHLNLPIPFVPVFVPAKSAFQEVTMRIAADRTKNVVISRLDSDDAISDRYLETVSAAARNFWSERIPKGYMVGCDGYFTDLEQIQSLYYNCSPFISVYTHRYQGENVYDGDHTRILDRNPELLEGAPWMQIIHGSNVDNRFYTKSKFSKNDRREMIVGELRPAESAWPTGFPPDLLSKARAVRDSWERPVPRGD